VIFLPRILLIKGLFGPQNFGTMLTRGYPLKSFFRRVFFECGQAVKPHIKPEFLSIVSARKLKLFEGAVVLETPVFKAARRVQLMIKTASLPG